MKTTRRSFIGACLAACAVGVDLLFAGRRLDIEQPPKPPTTGQYAGLIAFCDNPSKWREQGRPLTRDDLDAYYAKWFLTSCS